VAPAGNDGPFDSNEQKIDISKAGVSMNGIEQQDRVFLH
jgi:hypothetical protein